MIKVVCFDLDGVYFTPEGKVAFYNRLVEMSGSEEKVRFVLYESKEMLDFVTGKLDQLGFLNFINKYLNLSLSLEELADIWVSKYEINKEVRDYIYDLRSRGIKSATCSNNNPIRINALEEKFGFLEDFDIKVFSYECGFVKPSKEIFLELIKKSGVDPEDIIYSDDNEDKLLGAREVGIKTFVYKGFDGFRSKVEDMLRFE